MAVLKVYVVLTVAWIPMLTWIIHRGARPGRQDILMLAAIALAWPVLILMGLRNAIQKALRQGRRYRAK